MDVDLKRCVCGLSPRRTHLKLQDIHDVRCSCGRETDYYKNEDDATRSWNEDDVMQRRVRRESKYFNAARLFAGTS